MLGAIIYVVVAGRSFIRSVLLNNDDTICMNNKGLKNLTNRSDVAQTLQARLV